ncbi:FlaA1/EpsC-like NDP-sugar epimerase [Anaerosolibacter carboniphilus]|uniref:FlaA1/EpsC-like NDP-sugar epimerase n=1 Tax=Anaerosolibacter carboniphilus TaxID=1417629 RepID=A0A841KX91_9FIRM|nr:DUF3021 domain-containing protein [Anaerosolibacter carboniphilus]MBB6218326.1 FlaA1/EpsC-like NDP-sugar epimerase [Anaerosolibacter carboniphilus]
MKMRKYLEHFLKDFFVACGCLMIIVTIFMEMYSVETMKASLLWQIILGASAYTFYKYAFATKYELGKKAQLICFSISSTLADVMIVLWLFLFSPGRVTDKNLLIIYIIVILAVKGLVHAMMYIDGQTQAKQLNEKLSEYRNGEKA